MKKTIIVVVIGAVLWHWGCSVDSKLFSNGVDSGMIDYEVTFPALEEGDALGSIMPDRMQMRFSDGKYQTEFSAYGGVFKTNVLVDTKKKEYTQMLKVFRKRLACDFDAIDLEELLGEFPPLTIIKGQGTDTIAGRSCKHAIGVFHDVGAPDIDIYYTDEIDLKDPNWCTPFAEIDGVLLAYEVDMFDMRVRLRALDIQTEAIPKEVFAQDPEYKKVSYRHIRTEIEKLMDSFDI